MNHSIFCTDIALFLLLVLVLRRTRQQPAIHVHPCITVTTTTDLADTANKVDAIVMAHGK